MKFRAEIDVMTLPEILDPQGKVVGASLQKLGLSGVHQVRIGRHVTMLLEAGSESEARTMVEHSCEKLLANAVMEEYRFDLIEA